MIVAIRKRMLMLRTAILIPVGAFASGLDSNAFSPAQSSSNFEKKNFNYNEWTRGKFSEVVTVTTEESSFFLLLVENGGAGENGPDADVCAVASTPAPKGNAVMPKPDSFTAIEFPGPSSLVRSRPPCAAIPRCMT